MNPSLINLVSELEKLEWEVLSDVIMECVSNMWEPTSTVDHLLCEVCWNEWETTESY